MRDVSRAAGPERIAKYEVLRPLATGGMAEIFIARTRDPGRRLVVLKKLHPRLAIEREYVQMFHDEAVIASKLQHPNLVEVYELGLDEGEHYIAMEFLHGRDLSRLLRKMRHDRLPLTFQQAITIVRDIASGLHHAHERVGDDGALLNIIHRDISPHNVFLTYSGEVKVLDFGIAKANSQVARTRTGVLKGKAAYMSPEQALGETLDRRTDVFSMGIVLWELTTGRWLYRRRSELETLKAVVESDAPKPSTVRPDYPKDLEKIVMKALGRAPDKRWSTAGELRAALDELAAGWRFRPANVLTAKLMAEVFTDEVTAWEIARAAGVSLADHVAGLKPTSADSWEDSLGTDPEDAVSLQTRRAPIDTREIVETDPDPDLEPATESRPSPQLAQPTTWWWRYRRALVGSLIAGVLVGVVASVLALVSGGDSARPQRPQGGGSTEPGSTLPQMEEIVPAPPPPSTTGRPRTGPESTTPGAAPETKVPIVYPPPMQDDADKKRRPR
jgi:serine/threonine protein kinase